MKFQRLFVRGLPGVVCCLVWIFMAACAAGPSSPVQVKEALTVLPSLPVAQERALRHGRSTDSGSFDREQTIYDVKMAYDRILTRKEQIGISREVQGHFEKAVANAEKKFEEGEGDITQGSLTKLKLGLAGTLNDINQFESDIALARLDLERLLGVRIDPAFELGGAELAPRSFSFRSLQDFLQNQNEGNPPPLSAIPAERRVSLEKALVRVNQARSQFDLARKNRKMTRALLVTEVANYDFGIGNEKDLFETLIIYTRVLVGFYDALYHFNESVAAFEREYAQGD